MEKKKLRIYFWTIFLSISTLLVLISLLLPKEQTYEVRWAKLKEAENHPWTQLLKEYVQIDTSQPEGNTLSSAVFLAMLLEKEGIHTEIFESMPQKANLIAKIGPNSGPPVILHHHMDTAEVIDRSGWKYDPWDGVIHLGYLYGIGALDMKSMGLCNLYAFIKAHKEKWDLKRPVIYYASCAEEADFEAGTRWMLQNHPEYFPQDSLFITEGGIVEMITNQARWAGIEIGQKGYARFELKVNKEEKEKIDEELKNVFPDKAKLNPYLTDFIKKLSKFRQDFFKICLEDIENCVKDKKKEEILIPNYLKSLLFTEGYWIPKKNDEYIYYIATIWGEKLEDYVKKIEEIFKKYKISYKLSVMPEASISSPDTEEFNKIKEVYENYFKIPVFHYMQATSMSEAALFREKGILSYGICPVRFTIYDSLNINLYDENVYLPYYLDGLEITEKILKNIACR